MFRCLGRIVGPFPSPPFVHFQVNPVGLVPKKELGAFRMIVDMSNPPGSSINDFIEDEFATVSYASFKEAIKMIIECGKGAYMCKTDITSAFRLLPLHPDLYHFSLIKCADQFYVDRCLAMGTRSSCNLFEKVSCALQFRRKYPIHNSLNYHYYYHHHHHHHHNRYLYYIYYYHFSVHG